MPAKERKFTTADMAYIALMAVLISVCSWICVPLSIIPFTMQTFGVFCALGLLGGRRGFMAVLVYILMGAAGLPVFSGFTGGLGQLLGPTGGYILGFLFMSLFYWLTDKKAERSTKSMTASLLAGLLICYAFGTLWYISAYSRASEPVGLAAALSLCVFPFAVPDFIKLVLSIFLIRVLKKHLKLR